MTLKSQNAFYMFFFHVVKEFVEKYQMIFNPLCDSKGYTKTL